MKFLIVGLGNPGVEYQSTRHNIGFKVLDFLANTFNSKFVVNRHANTVTIKHKGHVFNLIQPLTFMNLSGKAVNYWLQGSKVELKNLLVISDDTSLPFGSLRLRGKGTHGGHNGLKDIESVLGTTNYARLKFGIGNKFSRGQQANYVLDSWSEEEANLLEQNIEEAAKVVLSFGAIGLSRTMNEFNCK